jgi:hypothetical protein
VKKAEGKAAGTDTGKAAEGDAAAEK